MKKCIECKTAKATHWKNNFCESCYRKLLQEKLGEEDGSEHKEKDKIRN